MTPFFSIITINLNNKTGLQATIKSVVRQTCKDFEYLIIDGGSIDGSLGLIKENEYLVNFLVSEKDSGIYDAMNKGIAKATGKYLMFLNSGDFFYDDLVLEKVKASLPIEDVVYGDVMLMKNQSKLRVKTYPDKLSDYYLLTDNVAHQSQFIASSLFKRIGIYNTEYKVVSDYDFFIRAYCKYQISYRHLNFVITAYNLDGFSAKPESVALINKERHQIQKKYMPSFLVLIYHVYSWLLDSQLYKNNIIKRCLNLLRDLVLKFIRTKN